ncbi:MAG: phasin superfamily protein [Desulfuromonadales bacterium]|nr:phasin superfamily protein [Desulfuromonadales bacterium]
MFELLEKTLLAGIGAMSLTRQKTEELIGELQKQFNLSEEKGKDLFAKMEAAVKENQEKLEAVAREEVRNSCARLGVVTEEEFDKLRQRVLVLEQKVVALENLPPASPPEVSPLVPPTGL